MFGYTRQKMSPNLHVDIFLLFKYLILPNLSSGEKFVLICYSHLLALQILPYLPKDISFVFDHSLWRLASEP